VPRRNVFLQHIVLYRAGKFANILSGASSGDDVKRAADGSAWRVMVIEVEIFSRLMPSNKRIMSSMESIATPTLPTSPMASGLSESEANLRR